MRGWCNHPLAARQISIVNGMLRTTCWACKVEVEIKQRPIEIPKGKAQW